MMMAFGPEKHAFIRPSGIGLLALLFLIVTGCGSDGDLDSENYGNLLASPAGLIVVEGEHPSGWGRPDCFTCHEMRNMHLVNRTGIPDLDLAAIRALIRDQGEDSCVQCHGTNGVEP